MIILNNLKMFKKIMMIINIIRIIKKMMIIINNNKKLLKIRYIRKTLNLNLKFQFEIFQNPRILKKFKIFLKKFVKLRMLICCIIVILKYQQEFVL